LNDGSLHARGTVLNEGFTVRNSVEDKINKKPANITHGEGAFTGRNPPVRLVTFSSPRAWFIQWGHEVVYLPQISIIKDKNT
jgi:hypothetical protein